MSTMSYKGYSARIEYDDEDGILFGRIAGIRDGVGFHADNVPELRAAFREAVDDYLATCVKLGKTPQKPYSGNVMFRISPEAHAKVALAAELAGKSLNQWAAEKLTAAALAGIPESSAGRFPFPASTSPAGVADGD
jgi:predicted HicB family RNase H-like nuclease